TIVALHGNPTWAYLWRHLAPETVDAARSGGRAWRLIAPDQLEMGFSGRLAHEAMPAPKSADRRRIRDRNADLDALVTTVVADAAGSADADVTSTTTGTEATGPRHPIVTIGHDWGGVLSLGWAARNTDIVDAAISLNTAVHQPEDAPVPPPLRATP